MKPKKTKSLISLCLGVISAVLAVMPIVNEQMSIKGGPASVFHRYDEYMVLFMFASFVTGILAIITGRSSKFRIGVVSGYMGVGASILIFLMAFLMHMCSMGSRINPLWRMKTLSSVTQKYCEQNEGHLPDAEVWCDQLLESVKDVEEFSIEDFAGRHYLPHNADERCGSIAFNKNLDGYRISDVDRQTVLLFETGLGWNQNGRLDILPSGRRWMFWPFFEGGYHFVFVGPDSTFTVEFIKNSKIDDLNWEPAE